MSQRVSMAVILLVVLVASSGSASAEQGQVPQQSIQREVPKNVGVVPARPDVLVETINFSTSVVGKMLTLTVTGTIYNNSPFNSWCCPTAAGTAAWAAHPPANQQFECKRYVRSYPNGTWTQLESSFSTMLNAHQRQNYNFTDTMPVGTQREYKIVLDTENWIQESRKDNNTKTRVFPGNDLRRKRKP